MKSMTGYGRGECSQNGCKITTELSSVNRKQSEISVYLPRELEPLEPKVRNEINNRIARGRITARINVHAGESAEADKVRLNAALAKAYVREFRRLADDLKIPPTISLDLLMRVPGVVKIDEALADLDSIWPSIEKAVQQALAALIKMREREGSHLAADLKARIGKMKTSARIIQKQAPIMVEKYREQLRQRIQEAGLPLPDAEDQRLIQEIVYFADRSDISEELTRLQSHFKQFEECARSTEPVGRTLDFLAQEINREVNTIAAKANDSIISREVVNLKAEIEKFREQVQNVE